MEFFKLDKERLKEINKKRNFSYYCRVRRTRTGERLTTSNRIKRNNKKTTRRKILSNCELWKIWNCYSKNACYTYVCNWRRNRKIRSTKQKRKVCDRILEYISKNKIIKKNIRKKGRGRVNANS